MKFQKGLLIILTIFMTEIVFCQLNENKFESKVGYGLYQGFNLGLNYFYKENLNAGIGIGSHFGLRPFENENHYNVFVENKLLFGQPLKQKIKPWFFNQQLMYWEQGSSNSRWKILSLGLNIGGTVGITDNLGLTFEIGSAFNWVIDVERDKTADITGWMWPILYNGRMQLVYLF